ncbi:cytochrome c biogenesis protein CcdA [Aerococcaceae bacterium zg-ZJ1578]|uniref:cytochrome c biogenesis CcdA family protein n=1 Tax=Aerococcaceae bacterium zg-252 TaxID=2796928 RepID=UPI001A30E148|nr:cytochrome c biogenesis protein CcdA [Aerococcaceae bacterium zg-1578]MBR7927842.1 cytochrome c biogenesis protein CcdA [Aerococcaceae bacterium zg-ZUI334]
MYYLLLFTEGILTFLSPCLLPMIPLYITFITGQQQAFVSKKQILYQLIQFIAGFTLIFIALNLFITTIGKYFLMHRSIINVFIGVYLILMGFDFLFGQTIMTKFMSNRIINWKPTNNHFIFGVIFALTWTPCVGVFLSAVLSQALLSQHLFNSTLLILAYTLGLSVPFILLTFFMKEMSQSLEWLKKQMPIIHIISSILLIIIGILILVGWYDYLLTLLV